MALKTGARWDTGLGRGKMTFTVPAGAGTYAPEYGYLSPRMRGDDVLDIVDQLVMYVKTLPATATVEVDLLEADGDPAPNGPWVSVAAARGGNFNVATGAFDYWISNLRYNKAAVGAGTALAAGTIPINQYGGYMFCIDAAGVITCYAAPDNFTTGYASAGAADTGINLITIPAGSIRICSVTLQTASGTTFVGGTDALTGGAGGNVARNTVYTNVTAVTGNWILNVGAAINSVGLKAAIALGTWAGVRIRMKSGGTGGAGEIHLCWK